MPTSFSGAAKVATHFVAVLIAKRAWVQVGELAVDGGMDGVRRAGASPSPGIPRNCPNRSSNTPYEVDADLIDSSGAILATTTSYATSALLR